MRRRSSRLALASLLVLVLIVGGFWFIREPAPSSPTAPTPDASRPVSPRDSAPPTPSLASGAATATTPDAAPRSTEPRSELVDGLNDPRSSIDADLRLLNEVFSAWLTHFREGGIPIGDNREITAALTGANPLGYPFVPADHPAINARGELCDRWGTPFRFHVLSRMQMEIRSAGPDRRFGTEDDAEWAPWPRNF